MNGPTASPPPRRTRTSAPAAPTVDETVKAVAEAAARHGLRADVHELAVAKALLRRIFHAPGDADFDLRAHGDRTTFTPATDSTSTATAG